MSALPVGFIEGMEDGTKNSQNVEEMSSRRLRFKFSSREEEDGMSEGMLDGLL
jgi:hypothetical protein